MRATVTTITGRFVAVLLTLSMGLASPVLAVPEQSIGREFEASILPYILTHAVDGRFVGAADLNIHYLIVPARNPKGVIVISPGRTEPSLKYAEFIYDLRDFGYTIFAIDHRGQGSSDRMLPDPIKSHVERFADYVDDFSQFVMTVVKPQTYPSAMLLAQSMGGAIAAGFLRQHPLVFKAAIFIAHMFEINTGAASESLSLLLTAGLVELGLGESYAYGQGPFDIDAPFPTNKETSSEARFAMKRRLFKLYPELRIGGVTNRWVGESLAFTKNLRTGSDAFQIPTILFQAGKDDYVRPASQNELCEIRSPLHCRIIHMPDSKHEILMESDAIRSKAMHEIQLFIRQNAP
jgi:lysophospholipase